MLNDLCIVTTDNSSIENRRFVIPRNDNHDGCYLCEVFPNFESASKKEPLSRWEMINKEDLEVIISDASGFFGGKI